MAQDEVVTLRTGRFWKDAGILRGECFEAAEETLEDAQDQVERQRAMLDGRPLPFLMDIRRVRSLSREARTFFASATAAEVFAATALLVRSPLSRAVGNFFLGLNKPSMPTRLFTDETEALAWLAAFAAMPPITGGA
jgi:hypothetical protein